MKNTLKITLVMALAVSWIATTAQTSRIYSVLTWATVVESPPSITVHFEDEVKAVSYDIFRKELGVTGWGSSLKNIAGGGTGNLSYEDNNVVVGKSYEYYVKKNGVSNLGHGYINVGINGAVEHSRGTLLLVIDQQARDSLGTYLDMLKSDLAGDGWNIVEHAVSRSVRHEVIKSTIADTKLLYSDLKSVYIFGHVAVPYSGHYCSSQFPYPPDGHTPGQGNHCGAWAADVFYAIPGGNWTDDDTTISLTFKSFNKNYKDDGKFDQAIIPNFAEYEVGRVDLFDMPAFSKSEYTLLKQYIQKAHDYKHVIKKPIKKALVEENFGVSAEAFGSNGYRNFAAMVGAKNIEVNDYLTTLKDSTYMWANVSGGGSFTSAAGVGTTTNFAASGGGATFNLIFGSFFGDWDNTNAFLRAPLALERGGLTNAWAGRPWWHTHTMAYNKTIGYVTKLVQNNQEYYAGAFNNNIHIALMGDPTLRMHMFEPATAFKSTLTSDKTKVDLTWTKSIDTRVEGYNVYMSRTKYGPYTKVNSTLITGTSFQHTAPFNGTSYYMVRAQRKEITLSGTFVNLSQGAIVEVNGAINLGIDRPFITNALIFPNPTDGVFNIRFEANGGEHTDLLITDIMGKTVYEQTIIGDGPQMVTLNLSELSKGIYVVKLNDYCGRIVIKDF